MCIRGWSCWSAAWCCEPAPPAAYPCKCSWFGQDPYWGRLASELGSAGIEFSSESISVSYGGVTVADGGVAIDHDAAAVAAHMAQRNLEIVCDLGIGTGSFTVLTNDLTHQYIDENTGGS